MHSQCTDRMNWRLTSSLELCAFFGKRSLLFVFKLHSFRDIDQILTNAHDTISECTDSNFLLCEDSINLRRKVFQGNNIPHTKSH